MTDSIAPAQRGRADVLRRGAVTVLLVLVFWALSWIRLPGATVGDLDAYPWWTSVSSQLSIGALGLTPCLWAFVSLAVLSRLIPAVRPRLDGPTLERGASVLALVLATVQALGHVQWLAQQRIPRRGVGLVPVFAGGGLELVTAALSLVAATALIGLLARTITRAGLGSGYSLLLGATALRHVAMFMGRARARPGLLVRPLLLAVAAAALLVLTLRPRSSSRPRIPLPTCGLLPIAVASWVFFPPEGLVALLRRLSPAAAALVREDLRSHGDAGAFVLAVALAPIFTRLFRARHADAAWAAADRSIDAEVARAKTSSAARWSVLLVGLLAAAPFVSRFVKSHWILDAGAMFGLAVLVAPILDVVAEARARRQLGTLVPACSLDRLPLVDPALAALESAGVPAAARSRHLHAVLQLFAPFAPVEILVPPERAAGAAAVCARVARAPDAAPPPHPSST